MNKSDSSGLKKAKKANIEDFNNNEGQISTLIELLNKFRLFGATRT